MREGEGVKGVMEGGGRGEGEGCDGGRGEGGNEKDVMEKDAMEGGGKENDAMEGGGRGEGEGYSGGRDLGRGERIVNERGGTEEDGGKGGREYKWMKHTVQSHTYKAKPAESSKISSKIKAFNPGYRNSQHK
jgi:hypothetical protein